MTVLSLADDFSPYLGGRYRADGPGSGEEFRDDLLVKAVDRALAADTKLTVVFDGVAGVPSSFLEEAFGGLLRVRPKLTLRDIDRVLVLKASAPELLPFVRLAHDYMSREEKRRRV